MDTYHNHDILHIAASNEFRQSFKRSTLQLPRWASIFKHVRKLVTHAGFATGWWELAPVRLVLSPYSGGEAWGQMDMDEFEICICQLLVLCYTYVMCLEKILIQACATSPPHFIFRSAPLRLYQSAVSAEQ